MKTINLKGKEYAPVNERVKTAHESEKKISINTERTVEHMSDDCKTVVVSFKATVETDKWCFTWHSFWKISAEKAFEKLESVAVGRALAFAWFGVDWWIASYEEVENFINDNNK